MAISSPLPRYRPSVSARTRARIALSVLLLLFGGALALLGTACTSFAVDAGSNSGIIKQNGWVVRWVNTGPSSPDGIAFFNATYHGTSVFSDIRVPFSYVDYTDGIPPNRDIVDQLGVIAWDGRTPTFRGCTIGPIKDRAVPGTLINCDYTFDVPGYEWEEFPTDEFPNCATYRYTQKLYIYADGVFRPSIATWGPGYRNPHAYVLGIRMDMAVGKSAQPGDTGWVYKENKWQKVATETSVRAAKGDANGFNWAVRGDGTIGGPQVTFKPGGDRGELFFLASSAGDVFDGFRHVDTPSEYLTGQSLGQGGDLYLWYRGSAPNPGCEVAPVAIGPTTGQLSGY